MRSVGWPQWEIEALLVIPILTCSIPSVILDGETLLLSWGPGLSLTEQMFKEMLSHFVSEQENIELFLFSECVFSDAA